MNACYTRIYALVRTIPAGRVMTYGQIAGCVADVCAAPAGAVQVGRAMAASARFDPDLPWWRVIGKLGAHGVLRVQQGRMAQRDLLAREGVLPDADARYDLARYGYAPRCEDSPGACR